MSSPSLESFKQIEAICTRFESEPHRGQLAIVKLLPEVDPGNRAALAMALLELDLELRNDLGESIVWEDYAEVSQNADVHIGEDVL